MPFKLPDLPGLGSPPAPQTTQSWLPIQSIRNGLLTRLDGTVVSGLLVHPLNLELMSRAEQHTVVKAFQAAIDRLKTPWQMVSTYRPVDLGTYRATLAERADHLLTGSVRKQVLEEYRRWILAQAQGQAVERIHAIVTQHAPGKEAAVVLHQMVDALHEDLIQIPGLHVAPLTDADWYRLIQLFFAESPGSLDTTGPGRLPPIYASSTPTTTDTPERMDP